MKLFCLILSILLYCAAHAQTVLDNKTYRVTAYKKGDNSVYSVSNYAEVIPKPRLYIPNAFTPNSDGINDSFGVSGGGEVIFESTSPTVRWDGTFRGRPAENGVYAYEVTAKGFENPKTGSVTLLR